jgi:hypothetical protein
LLLDKIRGKREEIKLWKIYKLNKTIFYLHRVFNFDHQEAFVVGGGASSAIVATGEGVSLITIALPLFLVHRKPLGSLRQARHLIPEQHLQYRLKDLPQRVSNFSLSPCFSLLEARTLRESRTKIFIFEV